MRPVEPIKHATDAELAGILELPTGGKVVELGLFPKRFSEAALATESGLWRLYLWNTGLWKRRIR